MAAIRRPRPKAKANNTVNIKLEDASPKAEKPKRKLEVYLASDDDFDNASIDSQAGSASKATRGGKGKQVKGSGSKPVADGPVAPTRKSTRLNASAEIVSKKARTGDAHDAEVLFRRLASEFATIGRTCEELADTLA